MAQIKTHFFKDNPLSVPYILQPFKVRVSRHSFRKVLEHTIPVVLEATFWPKDSKFSQS